MRGQLGYQFARQGVNKNGQFDSGTDTSTSTTCTTDNAGVCHQGNDATKAAFESLALGFYCVVETTTPTGYDKAAPQCFEIGLGGSPGTGQTKNLTFKDPPLHKVIVIVCHQRPQTTGADTLDPNDVTFDGVTKTSLGSGGLPSGITAAQVCGLGGASFADKAHNATGYSATVKIASH